MGVLLPGDSCSLIFFSKFNYEKSVRLQKLQLEKKKRPTGNVNRSKAMVLLEVLFFKFLLLKVIETEKIYIYIGKPLRMGKDYSLAIPNRDWKIFEN